MGGMTSRPLGTGDRGALTVGDGGKKVHTANIQEVYACQWARDRGRRRIGQRCGSWRIVVASFQLDE
jgi:hypothetical protein